MAEPTTNYIEIDGEGKYIEDTAAREGVTQNAADITALNNSLTDWQNIQVTPDTNYNFTVTPTVKYNAKLNLIKITTFRCSHKTQSFASGTIFSFTLPQNFIVSSYNSTFFTTLRNVNSGLRKASFLVLTADGKVSIDVQNTDDYKEVWGGPVILSSDN